MNIYVGNLPYSVRDQDLRESFEKFGEVKSAQVILDRRSRRSRGYGFVEMANGTDGEKAIRAMDGTDFQGRSLRVAQSNEKGSGTGTDSSRRQRPQSSAGNRQSAPKARAQPQQQSQQRGGIAGFFKRLFG